MSSKVRCKEGVVEEAEVGDVIKVAVAEKKAGKPPVDKLSAIRASLNRLGYYLTHDSFRDEILVKSPGQAAHMLCDLDEIRVRVDLLGRGVNVYESVIHDVMVFEAQINSFHPVRDYLDNLQWDGVPRIDFWLQRYLGAEDCKLNRKFGASVLIAAVRRVRQPGCKFDEALVLVGAEGSGKSSAIRLLSPEEGWVTDSLSISSTPKQVIEGTTGIWLVESAEMVGMKNIEHVKAFLSRQVDGPVRAAFARNSTSRPRQFIVIGTTNTWKPLANETGARRFWPVYAGTSDLEDIARDRDQLWAEAGVREMMGETTFIKEDLHEEVKRAQDEFSTPHPWREKIEENIALLPDASRIPIAHVWAWLEIDTHKQTREQSSEITNIMRKLNYVRAEKPVWMPSMQKVARVFEYLNPFDERSHDTTLAGAPMDNYDEEMSAEDEMAMDQFLESMVSPPGMEAEEGE